ncbi:integrase catalytic domain-containing protein [Nephila pilipes]|uniref:Integrase catalytic domain-containing protein n=1 Tax=Nephila pilipes TaxID=299642 RepID=A0A8X6MZ06_NEPPI|nr:integrase catalytic domain-containing protein [Nephila pilipes]
MRSYHQTLQSSGKLITSLPDLELIKIPRFILHNSVISIVLCGFSDASSKAIGTVIYLQSVSISSDITSRLLCSKSRVAPIKPMTVPRLELFACLLLSQLVNKVIRALKLNIDSIQLFTDSSIALLWINTSPHLLKTFVCNRVVQIQELSKDFNWKLVSSKSNPANLFSRGLETKALAASELWWKGPDCSRINLSDSQTLQTPIISTDKLYSDELKTPYKVTLKSNNDSNFLDTLIDITNNFHKLIRILGFIF